jgi:hypothetical protein
MVSVSLYVDNVKLDLFNDENISLTQSIQNVRDISKVFANFTKSFTVPASRVNNRVFKHYYNFNIDNGFDARKKVDAKIELNYLPFQTGKVQLEGVNLRNNEVYAYRIVFFGEIVDLKDILGEDKLSGLFWLSNFTRTYTAANILTDLQTDGVDITIGGTTYTDALCLPLITNTSQLFYDSGVTPVAYFNADGTINPLGANLYVDSPAQNNGVYFEELKYGIRIWLIIEAIERNYLDENGNQLITFDSNSFLKVTSNPQYYDLYMWLHREKGFAFKATQVTVLYPNFPSDSVAMTRVVSSPQRLTVFSLIGGQTVSYSLIVITAPAAEYTVGIYRNGLLYAQQTFAGTTTGTILSGTMTNGNYEVFVTGTSSNSIRLDWQVTDPGLSQGPTTFATATPTPGDFTLPASNTFDAQQQIPEMRIIDFLTALFKMFNLTAYKKDDGTIMVETLYDYYANGTLRRIDDFIDISDSQVNAALPYKEVTFEYEGRGTKLAQLYEQEQNVGWGTETFQIDNDLLGNPYKINVPFEHMQFERLPGTDVQTGYFIDDNNDPYIGMPLLFYRELITSGTNISVLTGPTSPNTIDDYCIPMNSVSTSDSTSAAVSHFFPEQNEYTPTDTFDETLFSEYYETYITNLFDTRRRLFKFRAVLPVTFLHEYGLQDTLQIWDTTSTINQITTNLTTGQSQLELLNVLDPAVSTTTTTTTAPPTTTTTSTTSTTSSTTTSSTTTSSTTTSTTTSSTTTSSTTTTTTAPPTTTTTTTTLATYYLFNACDGGTTVIDTLGTPPSSTNQRYVDFSVTPNEFYTYTGSTQAGSGGYPIVDLQPVTPEVTGCPTTTTTTSTQAYQTLLLYEQSGGGGWGTSGDACDGSGSILATYIATGDSVTVGTVIYTDTGLTTPLAGNNNWYQVQGTTDVIQVDASGEITAIVDCSATTTTTTTTTTSTTTTTTTTLPPTTTTTTSTTTEPTTTTSTTTSTTTTTAPPTTTTTTTTTAAPACTEYQVVNEGGSSVTFEYDTCKGGTLVTFSIAPGGSNTVCARTGTLSYVSGDFNYTIFDLGSC